MIKLLLTVFVFAYLAFAQIQKAQAFLLELRSCDGLILGWRDACVGHNILMLGSASHALYLAIAATLFALAFFVAFTLAVYVHAAHAALEAQNGRE